MTSLYNKYRPKTLEELVGQDEAVRALQQWFKDDNFPHALLLTGPSGCGKTTIARILRKTLGCNARMDFIEQNCADFRGIDSVRAIRRKAEICPIGNCRIFLLDECHQISSQAQEAMLKLLEDTPAWAYFFLCTTNPQKLIRTILTRVSKINLKSVNDVDMAKLIKHVAKAEGKKLATDVIDRIVETSEGSPRQALVCLQAVIGFDSEEKQIETIQKSDSRKDAIEIARALINPRTRWPDMVKILKACDLSDSEGLRHLILAYASSVLLGGGNLAPRAAKIVHTFQYDTFNSKKAGFLLYCYQIIATK